MTCELPNRTEKPYLHNGTDYVICMESMWSAYQDQRLACSNEQDCEDAIQCEADAWSLYETLVVGCGIQYPDNGSAPDCLLTAMAESLMRGGE